MVKVNDCSCECRDKGKEKMIEERALSSVNKIISTEGTPYYPDGTGAITMPVADASTILNAQKVPGIENEIKQMKISDAETDEAVKVLESVADNHAREIQALKSGSGDQSKEIQALDGRVTDVENKAEGNAADIAKIKATDVQQTKDIASVMSRVTAVEGKAATNAADIAEIRTAEVTQIQQISALQTLTNSITKSLITSVEVKNGTDNGSFMVNVIEEDGTKRTSNNYQYGKIASFELIQGTQAGYVRGRLTLVDGTEIMSNDFQILQITATDVYVTSITLQGDYQKGQIKGEIGYSNGNTAQIDPIDVPTAPGVTTNIESLLTRMSSAEATIKTHTSDISGLKTRVSNAETEFSGLKTRMSATESKDAAQDGEITALDQRVQAIEDTPGIGKFTNSKEGSILGSTAAGKVSANADGTGSINGWSDKADVSALNNTNATVATKANQTALDATNAEVAKKADQSDLTALQTSVQDCFNDVGYDATTNKLTFTALDGQSNAITLIAQEDPTDLRFISEEIGSCSGVIKGSENIYYNYKIREEIANFYPIRTLPDKYFRLYQTYENTSTPYYSEFVIDDAITTKIKAIAEKIKSKIESIYPTAYFSFYLRAYTFDQSGYSIAVTTTQIEYYKEYAAGKYSERWKIPALIKIPSNYTEVRPIRLILDTLYISIP